MITAVANDIGAEAIFARQVIAHGRAEDVLLAQSTSGNSANVIAALAEARGRGLATIAMVGYDGGADRRPRSWPTSWWSCAPSTSRGSRRPRPPRGTRCADAGRNGTGRAGRR